MFFCRVCLFLSSYESLLHVCDAVQPHAAAAAAAAAISVTAVTALYYHRIALTAPIV